MNKMDDIINIYREYREKTKNKQPKHPSVMKRFNHSQLILEWRHYDLSEKAVSFHNTHLTPAKSTGSHNSTEASLTRIRAARRFSVGYNVCDVCIGTSCFFTNGPAVTLEPLCVFVYVPW